MTTTPPGASASLAIAALAVLGAAPGSAVGADTAASPGEAAYQAYAAANRVESARREARALAAREGRGDSEGHGGAALAGAEADEGQPALPAEFFKA